MNCLPDHKIQEYIDNELTNSDSKTIVNHINSCPKCKSKVEKHKQFVNKLLSDINTEEKIRIPDFKFHKEEKSHTYRNSSKIKKLTYWVAAAVIITFFLIVFTPNQNKEQTQDMLFIEFEFETDANKPWSEQEINIVFSEQERNEL